MANNEIGGSNSPGCTNSCGQLQFHLRRIGPPASQPGVADIMDFHNITYMIGRNRNQVDYYIDSSDYVQRLSISRCHARVVRQAGNQHRLHDDSLNGIFVNNIKIAGSCILREGDSVTFGHPSGLKLPAGSRQRQPNSEHQFIFERCNCSTGNHSSRPVQTSAQKKDQFTKPGLSGARKQITETENSNRSRTSTITFSTENIRALRQGLQATRCLEVFSEATGSEIVGSRVNPVAGVAVEVTNADAQAAQVVVQVTDLDTMDVDVVAVATDCTEQKTCKTQTDESIAWTGKPAKKSPTKHASVQTSSTLQEGVFRSPSKDIGIQTSQALYTRPPTENLADKYEIMKSVADSDNVDMDVNALEKTDNLGLFPEGEKDKSGDKTAECCNCVTNIDEVVSNQRGRGDAGLGLTGGVASQAEETLQTVITTNQSGQTDELSTNTEVDLNYKQIEEGACTGHLDSNDEQKDHETIETTSAEFVLIESEAHTNSENNHISDERLPTIADSVENIHNAEYFDQQAVVKTTVDTGSGNEKIGNEDIAEDNVVANLNEETVNGFTSAESLMQEADAEDKAKDIVDDDYDAEDKAKDIVDDDHDTEDKAKDIVDDDHDAEDKAKDIFDVDHDALEQTDEVITKEIEDGDKSELKQTYEAVTRKIHIPEGDYNDIGALAQNDDAVTKEKELLEVNEGENDDRETFEQKDEAMTEEIEILKVNEGENDDREAFEQRDEVMTKEIEILEINEGENNDREAFEQKDEVMTEQIETTEDNEGENDNIVFTVDEKMHENKSSEDQFEEQSDSEMDVEDEFESDVEERDVDFVVDHDTENYNNSETPDAEYPFTEASGSYSYGYEESGESEEDCLIGDDEDTRHSMSAEIINKSDHPVIVPSNSVEYDFKESIGSEDLWGLDDNSETANVPEKTVTALQEIHEISDETSGVKDKEAKPECELGKGKSEICFRSASVNGEELADTEDENESESDNMSEVYEDPLGSSFASLKRRREELDNDDEVDEDSSKKRNLETVCSSEMNKIHWYSLVLGKWVFDPALDLKKKNRETIEKSVKDFFMHARSSDMPVTPDKKQDDRQNIMKLTEWVNMPVTTLNRQDDTRSRTEQTDEGDDDNLEILEDSLNASCSSKMIENLVDNKGNKDTTNNLQETEANGDITDTIEVRQEDEKEETFQCEIRNETNRNEMSVERYPAENTSIEERREVEMEETSKCETMNETYRKESDSELDPAADKTSSSPNSPSIFAENSDRESGSNPDDDIAADRVEDSMCYDEGEVECCEEQIKQSWWNFSAITPSKHMTSTQKDRGLSPVIRTQDNSLSLVYMDKLKSPVKSTNEASQLSCTFSDSDSEVWLPEMNFDNSDEDVDNQSAQRNTVVGKVVVDQDVSAGTDKHQEMVVFDQDVEWRTDKHQERVVDQDVNGGTDKHQERVVDQDVNGGTDKHQETVVVDQVMKERTDKELEVVVLDKNMKEKTDDEQEVIVADNLTEKGTNNQQNNAVDINENVYNASDVSLKEDARQPVLETHEESILLESDNESRLETRSNSDDDAADELNMKKDKQKSKRKCNFSLNESLKKARFSMIEIDESDSDGKVISDSGVVDLSSGNDDLTMETETKSTTKESPLTPLPGCSYLQGNSSGKTYDRSCDVNESFSCTQFIEDTEMGSQKLDNLSSSQVAKVTQKLEAKADVSQLLSSDSKNKLRALLEKMKKRKENSEPSAEQKTEAAVRLTSEDGVHVDKQRDEAVDMHDENTPSIESQVQNCKEVIESLRQMFEVKPSLKDNPRIQAWSQDLKELEKKLLFPRTTIAVVGDTGAGKSSLMNAILDHRSVLPTSGIRACTAVVVEVIQNTTNSNYEADIEFLKKEEWLDELKVLLQDLTSLDGTIRKQQPDPTSDAHVSYCKVKAVYGRIDTFAVLSRIITVTHWLGKVKVVSSKKPGEFRRQVEKYIETQDPGSGGQYWPIVKHVRLRMPHCDVCSSGAALVDLPGIRDSNAARDKIAREYLKNCTAVWVVSSIHRAIDDKTAKDLLGESFRRQLLMDGQYGSIAFICTKTDDLMPSEIIKSLKLDDKTKPHEDKVIDMEKAKTELELEVSHCNHEMCQLRSKLKEMESEVEEFETGLNELGKLLNPETEESEENKLFAQYQEELAEKKSEIKCMVNQMKDLKQQKRNAKQKIMELEKDLGVEHRTIKAICARARNEYSRHEIRRDFKAGLKEMKRCAGMMNEEEEEEEEDLYAEDEEEDEEIGSSARNLKVFCCSSTEYQKLKNLLTEDGPPQVFDHIADTQIPDVRSYVHEITSVRRQQALERLIRGLGRFVFDIHSYTVNGNFQGNHNQRGAQCLIDSQLRMFENSTGTILKNLSDEIDNVFDCSIHHKLEQGANCGRDEAMGICAKWGSPMVKDKTQDRRAGGLAWSTYRATTRRLGVYKSPTFGLVDFNEDLSEPMLRSLTIVWDKAFSGMLWLILENTRKQMLDALRLFTGELCRQLERCGVARLQSGRVCAQFMTSADHQWTEMVGQLKEHITTNQREISRQVTPQIQVAMMPTYAACSVECGSGMFNRMKDHMMTGVEFHRKTMFDDATHSMMKALVELKREIIEVVQMSCQTVIRNLKIAFEPLWDATANSPELRSALVGPIKSLCRQVRQLYTDAGLTNREEQTEDLQASHREPAEEPSTATVTSPVFSQSTSVQETIMRLKESIQRNSAMKATQIGIKADYAPAVKSEVKQEFPGISCTYTGAKMQTFGDIPTSCVGTSFIKHEVNTVPSSTNLHNSVPSSSNSSVYPPYINNTASTEKGNPHIYVQCKDGRMVILQSIPSNEVPHMLSTVPALSIGKPPTSVVTRHLSSSIGMSTARVVNIPPPSVISISSALSMGRSPVVLGQSLLKGSIQQPKKPIVLKRQASSTVTSDTSMNPGPIVTITQPTESSISTSPGKENTDVSTGSQFADTASRQTNLSMSRRTLQSNQPVLPPISIKEEPAETEVFGRRQRKKFLGRIDLTLDDSD